MTSKDLLLGQRIWGSGARHLTWSVPPGVVAIFPDSLNGSASQSMKWRQQCPGGHGSPVDGQRWGGEQAAKKQVLEGGVMGG